MGAKGGSLSRPAAVVALLLAVAGWVPGAAAAAGEPVVSVSAPAAAPGATVVVTLQGWPTATTVTLCGNEARRGAVDCDLPGGVGVPESSTRIQKAALLVTVPPVKCPCVLRAATPDEATVKTVPFDVVGVGLAPLIGPDPNAADRARPDLAVRARLVSRSRSFGDAVRSSLGGPTRRTLVLTLTNDGSVPLSGATLSAAVARETQGGEPLQAPTFESLAPGENRSYEIEVTLPAPAFGSYVVYGTVYGSNVPVGFAARTRTTPWALFLLVVALLVDLTAIVVLRLRRARRSGAKLAPDPQEGIQKANGS